MGRTLQNTMINLGLQNACDEAIYQVHCLPFNFKFSSGNLNVAPPKKVKDCFYTHDYYKLLDIQTTGNHWFNRNKVRELVLPHENFLSQSVFPSKLPFRNQLINKILKVFECLLSESQALLWSPSYCTFKND